MSAITTVNTNALLGGGPHPTPAPSEAIENAAALRAPATSGSLTSSNDSTKTNKVSITNIGSGTTHLPSHQLSTNEDLEDGEIREDHNEGVYQRIAIASANRFAGLRAAATNRQPPTFRDVVITGRSPSPVTSPDASAGSPPLTAVTTPPTSSQSSLDDKSKAKGPSPAARQPSTGRSQGRAKTDRATKGAPVTARAKARGATPKSVSSPPRQAGPSQRGHEQSRGPRGPQQGLRAVLDAMTRRLNSGDDRFNLLRTEVEQIVDALGMGMPDNIPQQVSTLRHGLRSTQLALVEYETRLSQAEETVDSNTTTVHNLAQRRAAPVFRTVELEGTVEVLRTRIEQLESIIPIIQQRHASLDEHLTGLHADTLTNQVVGDDLRARVDLRLAALEQGHQAQASRSDSRHQDMTRALADLPHHVVNILNTPFANDVQHAVRGVENHTQALIFIGEKIAEIEATMESLRRSAAAPSSPPPPPPPGTSTPVPDDHQAAVDPASLLDPMVDAVIAVLSAAARLDEGTPEQRSERAMAALMWARRIIRQFDWLLFEFQVPPYAVSHQQPSEDALGRLHTFVTSLWDAIIGGEATIEAIAGRRRGPFEPNGPMARSAWQRFWANEERTEETGIRDSAMWQMRAPEQFPWFRLTPPEAPAAQPEATAHADAPVEEETADVSASEPGSQGSVESSSEESGSDAGLGEGLTMIDDESDDMDFEQVEPEWPVHRGWIAHSPPPNHA